MNSAKKKKKKKLKYPPKMDVKLRLLKKIFNRTSDEKKGKKEGVSASSNLVQVKQLVVFLTN